VWRGWGLGKSGVQHKLKPFAAQSILARETRLLACFTSRIGPMSTSRIGPMARIDNKPILEVTSDCEMECLTAKEKTRMNFRDGKGGIFIELMTSDRKLKASREGSK